MIIGPNIYDPITELLERMIAEQRQTNELLIALVEGMADDGEQEDMSGPSYLDGSDGQVTDA